MIAQGFLRVFPLAVAVVLCDVGPTVFAEAPRQGQAVVQRPRRPAVSPYLNLSIGQSGALPSYHAFVVPRLEQQQQQAIQSRLQGRTQNLEQSIYGDPNLRATGVGGGFQNYSHFFPSRSGK